MTQMRSIMMAGPGGPEVLTLGQLGKPEASTGQVLIKVAAGFSPRLSGFARTVVPESAGSPNVAMPVSGTKAGNLFAT